MATYGSRPSLDLDDYMRPAQEAPRPSSEGQGMLGGGAIPTLLLSALMAKVTGSQFRPGRVLGAISQMQDRKASRKDKRAERDYQRQRQRLADAFSERQFAQGVHATNMTGQRADTAAGATADYRRQQLENEAARMRATAGHRGALLGLQRAQWEEEKRRKALADALAAKERERKERERLAAAARAQTDREKKARLDAIAEGRGDITWNQTQEDRVAKDRLDVKREGRDDITWNQAQTDREQANEERLVAQAQAKAGRIAAAAAAKLESSRKNTDELQWSPDPDDERYEVGGRMRGGKWEYVEGARRLRRDYETPASPPSYLRDAPAVAGVPPIGGAGMPTQGLEGGAVSEQGAQMAMAEAPLPDPGAPEASPEEPPRTEREVFNHQALWMKRNKRAMQQYALAENQRTGAYPSKDEAIDAVARSTGDFYYKKKVSSGIGTQIAEGLAEAGVLNDMGKTPMAKGSYAVKDSEGKPMFRHPVGSAKDVTGFQEFTKSRGALNSSKQKFTQLQKNLAEVRKGIGFWTTSWGGVLARQFAAGPGVDQQSRFDTIRAMLGFDVLKKMREESPTGGALGNVSELEIKFLQAVAGELEINLGKDLQEETINRIERRAQAIIRRHEEAWKWDVMSGRFGDTAMQELQRGIDTGEVTPVMDFQHIADDSYWADAEATGPSGTLKVGASRTVNGTRVTRTR